MTTNGIPIGCIGKGRLGEESIGKVIESNDSCAEPSADTDAPHRNPNGAVTELPADEAMPKLHECAVIELPLCDGTMHGVYQSSIDRWAELYPAVDIIQQLRAMVGWCEANPSKRKTKRGINKFINGWLAREQDRGGRLEALQGKDFTSTEQYKNLTMD